MTYHLEPIIEKIKSPVILLLPDGERLEYKNGAEAGQAVFEHHYVIESMTAVDGVVEVSLSEGKPTLTESLF